MIVLLAGFGNGKIAPCAGAADWQSPALGRSRSRPNGFTSVKPDDPLM
jgi:hypothetical protein